MTVRIWGPAQRSLVETFRNRVAPKAPRRGRDNGLPYYLVLQNNGQLDAVLRVDDVLRDNRRDDHDTDTLQGPEIHLSELIFDRKRTSADAAVMQMADALYDMIYCTYLTAKSIRVTFGFSSDPALCGAFADALKQRANFAAYKFKFEIPALKAA